MSDNKKLKTATRERMARTGEKYTTARMHLLGQQGVSREERIRRLVAPSPTGIFTDLATWVICKDGEELEGFFRLPHRGIMGLRALVEPKHYSTLGPKMRSYGEPPAVYFEGRVEAWVEWGAEQGIALLNVTDIAGDRDAIEEFLGRLGVPAPGQAPEGHLFPRGDVCCRARGDEWAELPVPLTSVSSRSVIRRPTTGSALGTTSPYSSGPGEAMPLPRCRVARPHGASTST